MTYRINHLSEDQRRDLGFVRADGSSIFAPTKEAHMATSIETEITNRTTAAIVAEINHLIGQLPKDGSIVYLSTDGSWGGAPDLTVEFLSDMDDETKAEYGIED